jgi:cytochrome c oxidase subunit 3
MEINTSMEVNGGDVNDTRIFNINPQLFSLWVGLASIVMLFGAFTSAYIVKQGAGNWLDFPIPNLFKISTAIIILSSFTLHISRNMFHAQKEGLYRFFLVVSFVLGITFVVCQYFGWQEMKSYGVDLKVNVAGSFFYLITAAHAAHVVGGIGALLATTINAFTLKFNTTENRKNRLEMVLHYWHFVDLLWVYLFIFLVYIK